MTVVGEATYELNARDAGLLGALGKSESAIRASGANTEKAFAASAASGMAKAETSIASGTGRLGGLFTNLVSGIGTGFMKLGGMVAGTRLEMPFLNAAVAAGDAAVKVESFGTKLNMTDKQTEKLGGRFADLKTGLVQGLGIGGFMAVSSMVSTFIGKVTNSVQLASNLNETISKSNVTFGASANDILEWSKTTSSSMGLAQQSALDYASTFGGLLTNFGMAPAKVAPMSKSLVQLAADMASFSNSSPEEALTAIQSGLVGEQEPLRRFQVNLSQARIEAEAMRAGLWNGKGTIDATAKATATYNLIMADTARQQGDFARTSTGLANTQRTDAAMSQEAWTNFGKALLPIGAVIIPAVSGAITGLVTMLTTLLTHGREVVPALAAVGAVVSFFVLPPFIAWAAATLAIIAPFVAVGAAVGALVLILDRLGLLGPLIDAFWNVLAAGAGIVGQAFDAVLTVIRGFVSVIIGTIRNVVGVAASIPGPWQAAAAEMQTTLQGMQNDVDMWGKSTAISAGKAADDIVGGVADGLAAGAPAVAGAADTAITGPIVAGVAAAKAPAVAKARELPGAIGASLQAGRDSVASGADALKAAFKSHIDPMKEIAQLQGDLTGKLMKRGLSSNDPIIRAAALQWQTDVSNRLFALRNNVGKIALATGQNYGDALHATKNAVAAKAAAIARAAELKLIDAKQRARDDGESVGVAFAAGIGSKGTYLGGIVSAYLMNATRKLHGASPPPEGPLHTIDVDAQKVGTLYADSIASQADYLARSIGTFLGRGLQAPTSLAVPVVPPGAVQAALGGNLQAAPVAGAHTQISIGDIHVPVTFAGPPPSDAATARALGRSLGEEIRLTLVRTPGLFPVPG